ncbi:MAG: hypothetical protein A2W22_05030 [Candidatus Levybacteria bacterium RBG_16_35_11]|nr:MAG: hypothetical protein A2W22_05030 [Candidatus Levybacteria bacterium RBG_16_35_11]
MNNIKKSEINGWNWLLFILASIFFYVIYNYLIKGIPYQYAYDLGVSAQIQAYFIKIFNEFGPFGFLNSLKWRGDISGPTFYIFSYFYAFIDAFFIYIFHDIFFTIKSIQVLEFLLAFMFMYSMTHHFTNNKYVSLLSGILYTTNPLFLLMLSGNTYIEWGFTILPISILYIHKYIISNKIEFAVLSGILFSMSALYSHIQFIFFFGIFFILFIFLAIFTEKNNSFTAKLFLTIKVSFIICIVVLLSSSFFLIPTFFEPQVYSPFSEKSLEIRKQTEVLNFYSNNLIESSSFQFKEMKVSLISDLNTTNNPKIYLLYTFIFYTILSVFTLFIKKNQRINIIFFIIGLMGFLLSLGPNKYFPGLYDILFRYFPYFDMVRTPDRFVFISVLTTSFLSANSIFKIMYNIKILKSKNIKTGIVLIIILTMTYLFLNTFPFFETKSNTDETYPDLNQVQDFLQVNNPNYNYRVLDLTVARNGNPSYINYYSIHQRYLQNQWDVVDKFYRMKTFANILGQMNIKYIITSPNWAASSDFELFPNKINYINNNSDFKEILKTSNGISIYENILAEPRMYIAYPILVFGGPNVLEFNKIYSNEIKFKPVFVFANQISNDLFKDLNLYKYLIIQNSNYLDVIYSEIDPKYKYEPFNYKESNCTIIHDFDYVSGYGVLFNDPAYRNSFYGESVLSNNLIYCKNGDLNIPFNVENNTEYQILTRIFQYNNSNSLSSSVDNIYFKSFNIEAKKGFRWIDIGKYNLSQKFHNLNLNTKRSDSTYIDTILIIPSANLSKLSNELRDKINKSTSKQIYSYDLSQFMLPSENDELYNIYSSKIEIFKDGEYLLRLDSPDNIKLLSFRIDNEDPIDLNKLNYKSNLSRGFHNISFKVLKSNRDSTTILYLIESNNINYYEQYTRNQPEFKEIKPNQFEVDIKRNTNLNNSILVFTDTYSPNWELTSNGNNNHSLPINFLMNGFFINNSDGTGKYIIDYNLSLPRKIGIILTLIPYLMLCILILIKLFNKYNTIKSGD